MSYSAYLHAEEVTNPFYFVRGQRAVAFKKAWLQVGVLYLVDPDMGPLTLASTITPLSSPGLCSPSPSTQLDGLEHDTEMDPGRFLSFENVYGWSSER